MSIPVAVITADQDITADLVAAELHRREVGFARFDLVDVPERMSTIAYLVNGRRQWTGALRGDHRDVDLSAVRAVWWRKPTAFGLSENMTATDRQWAAAEAAFGFGGLLAALPVRWVGHPVRNAAAEYKPHQLAAAAAAGLSVPDSLLTSCPVQARDFCATHRHKGVVYKPLRGGPGREDGQLVALRVEEVTAEEITDAVAHTLHLFQVRVRGYAVRLTVVGQRMFAVRLDSPAGSSAVDWRTHPTADLVQTVIEVPDDVADAMRQLMATFGLEFASSDFIVEPDGTWQFLDLNPNGQWAWLRVQRPIASAIADELTREST